jgi:hypothetical protein
MHEIIKTNQQEVVAISPMANVRSLIGQAQDLAIEHETFQANYIITGRKVLYGLLAKILDLVEQFDAAIDKEDLLEMVRTKLHEQYGIRTQQNTSNTTLLVRFITRADRKTAHVYTRAIEAARANQISPAHFPQYIEQAGGVERIRIKSVDGFISQETQNNRKKKLELVQKYLDARKEFPLTNFRVKSNQPLDVNTSSGYSLALCSHKDSRYFVLVNLPVNEELENKLIELLIENLPEDLGSFSHNIERFHKKAMQKRSDNTLKQFIRKKPEVAKGILRIRRIQNLTKSQSI